MNLTLQTQPKSQRNKHPQTLNQPKEEGSRLYVWTWILTNNQIANHTNQTPLTLAYTSFTT